MLNHYLITRNGYRIGNILIPSVLNEIDLHLIRTVSDLNNTISKIKGKFRKLQQLILCNLYFKFWI